MKKALLGACAVTLATALAGVGGGSAQAAPLDTSMCSSAAVTQEFRPWGDSNWYAPIPGMTATGFTGAGWTLSDGARIVTSTLPNGSTGTVLDLPSGAKALSPVVCITNSYPTARGWLENVKGSDGVGFYVSYALRNNWITPKLNSVMTGPGASWSLPAPLILQPTSAAGWQPITVTLVGRGTNSEYQVSDLELDPRYTH